MKILITGANGTIGSDLVNFFSNCAQNNKVIAFYRTPNFVSKNLRNKNVRWVKQDLRKKILYGIYPKILIHCVVAHAFSKKNTYLNYLDSNITALKNVIEFAKEKKIEKFFYLSSFKIYGDTSKINKNCNIFTNPDILGATKILSEKMVELQKFIYLNIRMPGVLTYYLKDKRRPWLNNIINKLKKNQIVNIYNSETLFNNIVDTYEIFKFVNYLIKKKSMKKGTLNFSVNKPIKVKSMIYDLKKKLSSKSKIILKKNKTKRLIILPNQATSDYGFNIASTTEIVNRYVENYAGFSLIDNYGKY